MATYRVITQFEVRDFKNRSYDKHGKQTADEYIEKCQARGLDVEMQVWKDHQCSRTEYFSGWK